MALQKKKMNDATAESKGEQMLAMQMYLYDMSGIWSVLITLDIF